MVKSPPEFITKEELDARRRAQGLRPVERSLAVQKLDAEKIRAMYSHIKLPIKVWVGRWGSKPGGLRIDLVDAEGQLLAHFHPVPGHMEETLPWEKTAEFFASAADIIETLLKEK